MRRWQVYTRGLKEQPAAQLQHGKIIPSSQVPVGVHPPSPPTGTVSTGLMPVSLGEAVGQPASMGANLQCTRVVVLH